MSILINRNTQHLHPNAAADAIRQQQLARRAAAAALWPAAVDLLSRARHGHALRPAQPASGGATALARQRWHRR